MTESLGERVCKLSSVNSENFVNFVQPLFASLVPSVNPVLLSKKSHGMVSGMRVVKVLVFLR